jgi:hypothetical protein
MKQFVGNERGIALAVAILAMVIVGALVAGAMFAGTQEQRVGENARRMHGSFGVAELGATEVVRSWDVTSYNTLRNYPLDSVAVAASVTPNKTGSYGGYVYKMNGNVYLVDITGRDTASATGRVIGGGGRQRIGVLTKITPLQFSASGALVTEGNLKISNITISGYDSVPHNWTNCPPLNAGVPGIHVDSGAKVGAKAATVVGNPSSVADNLVQDSVFENFVTETYATLAARANIVYTGSWSPSPQPVVTGGTCDRSVNTNWGDGLHPNAPCGNYFPVIHVIGDLKINSGVQGQGILLVDGKVDIKGAFNWAGILIAGDDLKTGGGAGGSPTFQGTVLSADKTGLKSKADTLDTSNFQYSSCAITRAMQGTSLTRLMRSRGWVQLF